MTIVIDRVDLSCVLCCIELVVELSHRTAVTLAVKAVALMERGRGERGVTACKTMAAAVLC